jgi:hypothetical protein
MRFTPSVRLVALAAALLAAVLVVVAVSDSRAQQNQGEQDPNRQDPGRRYRRDRPDRRGYRDANGSRDAFADSQPSGTQPATGPSAQGRRPMAPEYAVLLRRSVFARTGEAAFVPGRATTTSAPSSAPVLTPEQAVVFVGVLAQDDEYMAFAENQVTHQITILRSGDDVARGKVAAITLDTIAYVSGGAIKEVHLGQNLAGEVVASSLSSGSSSTAPSGPTPAGLTAEQQAIFERMRQRRQREGGGQ